VTRRERRIKRKRVRRVVAALALGSVAAGGFMVASPASATSSATGSVYVTTDTSCSAKAPNEVNIIHSDSAVNYYVKNNNPASSQFWAFYKSGTNNSPLYSSFATLSGSTAVSYGPNLWLVLTTATWANFADVYGLGSYLLQVSNSGKIVGGDSFNIK